MLGPSLRPRGKIPIKQSPSNWMTESNGTEDYLALCKKIIERDPIYDSQKNEMGNEHKAIIVELVKVNKD